MPQAYAVDAHHPLVNVFRHTQPLGYQLPMPRGVMGYQHHNGGHHGRAAMIAHEQQRIMAKEAKPRLHKTEVELLENEFRANPKPLSQRKRELARQIGLPLPRINVSSSSIASRGRGRVRSTGTRR